MKRAAVWIAALCLASPIYAARRLDVTRLQPAAPDSFRLEILPNGREEALKLMRSLRESMRTPRVRANAIADNRSVRGLVIPAVGSVRGANNTFFRSDITFVNWNDTAQRVGIVFLPQNNPAGTVTATTTLPGNRPPFTIADFVGTQLQREGLGALIILPIDAAGNVDDNGAIDAYSRIYTPQPGAVRGTVSQPFPAVDPAFLDGQYEGAILGLRLDADFRTNYGIVNLSDVPLPFSVLVVPESAPPGTQLVQIDVTLPALSMTQSAVTSGANGQMNLIVGVEADIPNDEFSWIAYASTTDNTTGDGYVSIAAAIFADEDLDDRDL
jgi:hypothetical protein